MISPDARDLFPLKETAVYLNHCGFGVTPREVMAARAAINGAGQCCFKGGERNYSSDAPGRREDRYCVGDIPKEALNNRLKWAESL